MHAQGTPKTPQAVGNPVAASQARRHKSVGVTGKKLQFRCRARLTHGAATFPQHKGHSEAAMV